MIRLTSLLFFLSSIFAPVLCCNELRRYERLSNSSLSLIQLMGREPTNLESPVRFPYGLYERMANSELESQLAFIRDSLEMVFDLYQNGNLSSVTWDLQKTEHFQILLHQQMECLNPCISTKTKTKTHRQLRRYYRTLKARTLGHTGGSSESWELIRSETKHHLQLLHLLVASSLHPDASSMKHSSP